MSTSNPMVITGATGALGGLVARALDAQALPLRLVVRPGSTPPDLPGHEVAYATYADGAAMRQAFEGADTVFFVSGREAKDRLQEHLTVVEAAAAAGVRRIVYTSFLAAAVDSTFTLGRDHYATEQAIRSTEMEFTFLRDSLYLDFMPLAVWEDGVIRGPAGDGRVACVARHDVADVAVAVLTGSGHEGKTYDLTGPVAMTFTEIAAELTRLTGRPVRFENETLDEARASRAGFGVEAWEVEGWVSSYAAVGAGELDVVSDDVPRLTGHPARSLADVLASNDGSQH